MYIVNVLTKQSTTSTCSLQQGLICHALKNDTMVNSWCLYTLNRDFIRYFHGPFSFWEWSIFNYGGVMQSVDVPDSKSGGREVVWIRVPPPPPAQLTIRAPCKAEHVKIHPPRRQDKTWLTVKRLRSSPSLMHIDEVWLKRNLNSSSRNLRIRVPLYAGMAQLAAQVICNH